MNVIVSNRQKDIIDNANIDAIKDLNGLFNVSDLINKFKNYFFSKMILDATSVVDFASKDVLTTLANEIGPEKLIILLPSSPEPPLEFKKLLVELKIYNFTNNIEDVIKFIEKSNTYDDAMKLIDESYNNGAYVDNSIKDGELDDSSNTSEENSTESVDESSLSEESNNETSNDVRNDFSNQNSHSSLGDILNNLYLEGSINQADDNKKNKTSDVQSIINNYEQQSEESSTIPEINNPMPTEVFNEVNNPKIDYDTKIDNSNESTIETNSESKNTFLITDDFNNTNSNIIKEEPDKMVIGFKNITTHAGATSLIYMLHKMATVSMKKDVLSIEVNKNDFRLFRDSKMISTKESELSELINNSNSKTIFVDLNDANNFDLCNEVLFLVEPSTIKLNELMATNKEIFKELKNKKVLLNKSLLSSNDIRTLESEAGVSFFANIEPLNDRILNDSISKLLDSLGIR